MRVETLGADRTALRFGDQKINLHEVEHAFELKAAVPMPGSADLCFVVATTLDAVMAHLAALGITLVECPVEQSGAMEPIRSVYVRDPDGNLIESSNPLI